MQRFEHELTVDRAHPALAGHFPGDPVVPGALLLAEVVACVERCAGTRVVRVARAKFPAVLAPAVIACIRVERERAGSYRAVCLAGGTTFLEATLETQA